MQLTKRESSQSSFNGKKMKKKKTTNITLTADQIGAISMPLLIWGSQVATAAPRPM
jgi:hypothetical protein